jgi:hypothetical protein
MNPRPKRVRNPGQRELLAKYRLNNERRKRRSPWLGYCAVLVFLFLAGSMANFALRNEARLVELERRQPTDAK